MKSYSLVFDSLKDIKVIEEELDRVGCGIINVLNEVCIITVDFAGDKKDLLSLPGISSVEESQDFTTC